MRYGAIEVPWTSSWSSEGRWWVAPCPHVSGRHALHQHSAPGQGKPLFGKPHSNRQRAAIAQCRCDLCGKRLNASTKVSLSHARIVAVDHVGLVPTCVEPLLHRRCAAVSLRQCPELLRQAQEAILSIRQVFAYTIVAQDLTGDATMEFAGVREPGTVGHLKMALTRFEPRDAAWLEA